MEDGFYIPVLGVMYLSRSPFQKLHLPTPRVLLTPTLYPLDPAQHPPRHLPGLDSLWQPTLHHPPPPADSAHWTHDCRRARSKGLDQPPLVCGVGHLLHRELALQDVPALGGETLAGEGEDGVAGDAFEDGAVEGGGEELLFAGVLVAHGDEEVHGPNFRDVLLSSFLK